MKKYEYKHYVKMTKFLILLIVLMLFAIIALLPGCSGKSDNWHIGKWTYDSDATKANLPQNIKAKGVPEMMAEMMGTQLVTQLMSQMNNVNLDITTDKITYIFNNNVRKSHSYNITERPDANTIVIESEEPATFVRSGKHICIPSTGAVEFLIYFKPAN